MMRSITYFLTRDSNCSGELSPSIEIWYKRPLRVKLTFDRGYVWIPCPMPQVDLGLYGSYTVERVTKLYGVVPDDDMQCIRVETQVEDKQPAAKK
jgi:hypothetical protein